MCTQAQKHTTNMAIYMGLDWLLIALGPNPCQREWWVLLFLVVAPAEISRGPWRWSSAF